MPETTPLGVVLSIGNLDDYELRKGPGTTEAMMARAKRSNTSFASSLVLLHFEFASTHKESEKFQVTHYECPIAASHLVPLL